MAAPAVIVVDTNVIAACPRLDSSPAVTSLVEHTEDWRFRLVVLEVVAMESVSVVRRRLWQAGRRNQAACRSPARTIPPGSRPSLLSAERRKKHSQGTSWSEGPNKVSVRICLARRDPISLRNACARTWLRAWRTALDGGPVLVCHVSPRTRLRAAVQRAIS